MAFYFSTRGRARQLRPGAWAGYDSLIAQSVLWKKMYLCFKARPGSPIQEPICHHVSNRFTTIEHATEPRKAVAVPPH